MDKEAVVSKELTVDAVFRLTISSDGQIAIPADLREFGILDRAISSRSSDWTREGAAFGP